jgi:DNA replication protein DnaC
VIDFRHLIGHLLRKPGAFAGYRWREELFPSRVYRAAYDHLERAGGAADKRYLELLKLAADEGVTAVERGQKRTARLLAESGLPDGKTLSSLDEALLPLKVRRQLSALIEGGFVERSVNVLAFGLPGRGKTHFHAALGRELILLHSKRVLFRPAFKLVGQLLAAKRDLRLEQELKKLDRFDVLILDDIGYVQQSREEMEVFFTLLAERYERRSLLISSNLVFSQWDQIFKDPMTTMAAIDRLVHHSIILEFDGASQRVKKAAEKASKQEAGSRIARHE